MLRRMTPTQADDALQRLLEGNHRFVEDRRRHVPLGARLREVAPAQAPFCAVLGCSDARVPAEIIFDCSLGDLFVVRNAGHVLSSVVLGSLEYAALRLRVPLIVVLGHTRCGALQAAVTADGAAAVPASLGALIDLVRPAVERARGLGGDLLDNAILAHVEDIVAELRRSEALGPLVERGALEIVGAVYDLDSGSARVVVR